MEARVSASRFRCSSRAPWAAKFASSASRERARRSRQSLVLRRVTLASESAEQAAAHAKRGACSWPSIARLERRALSYALSSAGVAVAEADFAAARQALEAAWRSELRSTALSSTASEGRRPPAACSPRPESSTGKARVRGIVLVNVLARAGLSEFRAAGFDAYLVRPVRPASMMMHLGFVAPAARTDGARRGVASLPCTQPTGVQSGAARPAGRGQRDQLAARQACPGEMWLRLYGGRPTVRRRSLQSSAILQGEARGLDLVLMDIFMPQLDGLEAARAIKELYAKQSAACRRRRSSR